MTMNSQWQAYLGAHAPEVLAPGDVGAETTALVDLSPGGRIAVAGADALSFLQGQLTNDLRELSSTHSQLSSHCSQKGRMLACFRVLAVDDLIYFELPREQVDALIARLKRYVLRSKVTLTDASDALIAIGLAGPEAEGLLTPHFPQLPSAPNGVARAGELTLIRIPGTPTRFELLGPEPAMETLWGSLATVARPAHGDYWRLLDIRAGLPSVYPATSDAFVPQMVNLHLIDGVSFTKGCYTGQEVVARSQYLGKQKRRMYRAEVASTRPPLPGDALFCPTSTSEQGAGRVVDAVQTTQGYWELLAVLEIEAAESGEVRLDAEGPVLAVTAPPYGLGPESAA